ncbi:hypothetical protein COUCH_24350 [Couchioplanes caeruleus]|uniref:hypothetical protein n=1 Tax=Couchioplanes caeruleus TaxID=56438 RepID=UPI0020BD49C0|nr:hypothetical protein [Couchioplanes caeruleus]UQU62165.1 hypothetical protein COUCH_24350 [Couchioplanes caeruleus]
MRIGGRRLGVAVAVLLLIIGLAVAGAAVLRWKAAGVAHAVTPPAGAVAPTAGGPNFPLDVIDRAGIVAFGLRTDRGDATVRMYALPPGSPWLQARKVVATQLDHWEQIGDCADDAEAVIVECAWREPARWWPRKVVLTMMRTAPGDGGRSVYVVIGSGLG